MAIEVEFLPHQERLFFAPERIKGMYCGRGAGKSYYCITSVSLDLVSGLRSLYFCQTNAVMEGNFLPEIKATLEGWGFVPVVNEKKHTIRVLGSNGVIFYYSYENYENARGASKIRKIYFDEIALAPRPALLFSAVAPCMRDSGGKTELIFASTPKKGTEWDKWVKSPNPPKHVITGVTMDDNPKASEEEKALIRSLITDPNFYRQEINGEIIDDGLDFCVVQAQDFPKIKQAPHGWISIGVDCAGDGRDTFQFYATDDSSVVEKVETTIADTTAQLAILRRLVLAHDAKQISIDTTGGFGNALRDLAKMAWPNLDIEGVNFGQAAYDSASYANARAEMYFVGCGDIRDGFFVDEPMLMEELMHTTFITNKAGKTILVPKEEIKALIGRSPDRGDAFCLARYRRKHLRLGADPAKVAAAFLKAYGH